MKLTHTANKEWGSKARKEQEALRGLTHADARRAISEELNAIADQREAEQAAEAEAAVYWAEYEAEQFAIMMDEEFSNMLDRYERER